LLAAASASGCLGPEEVGDESVARQDSSIINGYSIGMNFIPRVVAVHHGGVRPCSGTLIDGERGWVLTAAHCLTTNRAAVGPLKPVSSIRISQGVFPGLTPPPNAVTATRLVIHGSLDLALVQVSGLLWEAGDGSGLWLPPPSTLLNTTLRCYGYGRLVHNTPPEVEDGTTGAGELRFADLPVTAASSTSYQLSTNAANQILGHGDSGGPCYFAGDFGGDFGRFVTGVHRTSDSMNIADDEAVSGGAAWIIQTIGSVFIYRAHGWVSGRKFLDVQWGSSAAGTPVWTWPFNGGGAQRWTFDPATKAIRNENGMCLDVKFGGNTNHTPVWMWECNGSPAQQWEFTSTLAIRNVNGKCLDVPNGDTNGGVALQIFDCNGSSAQRWVLSPSPS